LNWDGSLILADSWYPQIAKSQQTLTPGKWYGSSLHRRGLKVYVDGALWGSGRHDQLSAGVAISFGAGESPTSINATADLYFDDILVDAGSFAATGFAG